MQRVIDKFGSITAARRRGVVALAPLLLRLDLAFAAEASARLPELPEQGIAFDTGLARLRIVTAPAVAC